MTVKKAYKNSQVNKTGRIIKRRYSAEFWMQMLSDYDQSSVSLDVFCAQRGLAVSTFQAWRKKLFPLKKHKESLGGLELPSSFSPIYVSSAESSKDLEEEEKTSDYLSSGLFLELSGGLKVSIGKDFDGPTFQRLVHLFSGS
jgi:hypothetical protein